MICSPVKTVDEKLLVNSSLNKGKGRFTKDNLEFVNAVATQLLFQFKMLRITNFEKEEHKKWNL